MTDIDRVFVSNGNLRKTLSVVRSLGRHGIDAVVGEENRCSIAGFSRYCGGKMVYPSPRIKPEQFLQWLDDVVRKNDQWIFFAMDEPVMEALYAMEPENRLGKVMLPSLTSYRIAADKAKTALLAEAIGVPCPWSFYPQDEAQLREKLDTLSFPCIIKPCRSSGSRGIRKAETAAELIQFYQEIISEYSEPLIQEYVGDGARYDVCLLFNRSGELRASFVQKELRHFPLRMGPSTAQESVVCPELVELSLKMMEQLPWRGVVELEYIMDEHGGNPKLLEINPRYWNSLELAVLAGVDFPWLHYQIARGEDPKPVHTYKAGIRCHNILPGEVLHFLTNPARLQIQPPIWGGKKYRLRDDIIRSDDIGPVLGFILTCLHYLGDTAMWRMVLRR